MFSSLSILHFLLTRRTTGIFKLSHRALAQVMDFLPFFLFHSREMIVVIGPLPLTDQDHVLCSVGIFVSCQFQEVFRPTYLGKK